MNKNGHNGFCGNPTCKEPRASGRYVCEFHAKEMDRIKKELVEDPRLLYHQRSDSKMRVFTEGKQAGKRKPRGTPVCCAPGCYEHRMPPEPYCLTHQDYAGGD